MPPLTLNMPNSACTMHRWLPTKRTELKSLTKADPQLYQEFSAEIAKMDSTYKKLNA
jgi:hypothetical protein